MWIRFREWILQKNSIVVSCFLGTTLLFLSPYWLENKLWIGSSDNLFHMIPNHLFSLMSLHKGSLGLWNPYVLTGIDFTASTHNYISNPLMWPLFLLPQDWFFDALTLKVGADYFLIGLCAYLFLKAETGDWKWSLFGGLVYQVCGMSLFSFTTYPCAQLLWLIPLTLYWAWTRFRQLRFSFILGLSILFSVITLTMNITYVFGTYLALAVFLAWFVGQMNPNDRRIALTNFLISLGVMVLLTAWHWLPIAESLFFRGSRLSEAAISAFHGNIYYFPRALIGEMFGINLSESSTIQPQVNAQGHAQFHGLPYLGVIPCMLAGLAVFFIRRLWFWAITLMVAVTWSLQVPPLGPVMEYLAQPFNHDIVPKMCIPIPFAVLVAYGGRWLEDVMSKRIPFVINKILYLIFGIWVLTTLVSLLPWIYPYRSAYVPSKVLCLALIGLVLHLMTRSTPKVATAGLAALALTSLALIIRSVQGGANDYSVSVVLLSSLPIALFCIFLIALTYTKITKNNRTLWLSIGIVVLGCLVCLKPLPPLMVEPSFTFRIYKLGVARLAILTVGLGIILRLISEEQISAKHFFLIFLSITLLDLLPANKNFTRQVTDFFVTRPIYPEPFGLQSKFAESRALGPMDVENYRLNWPTRLLQVDHEAVSNRPMIYGVHMFGGLNSDVPKRLRKLVQTFEPTELASSGIALHHANERMLDILGARYSLTEEGKFLDRPTAIPRFAFFEDFEVVDREDMVEQISRKDWVPTNTLFVHDKLRSIEKRSGALPSLRLIKYHSDVPERITLNFETENTGYLLFNDGFDPSWTVKINGMNERIVLANQNFMAAPIRSTGIQQLEFEFRPSLFFTGLKISSVALILLAIYAFYFLFRLRSNGVEYPQLK